MSGKGLEKLGYLIDSQPRARCNVYVEQAEYIVIRKKLELLCCIWILIEIRVKNLSSSQDIERKEFDLPIVE